MKFYGEYDQGIIPARAGFTADDAHGTVGNRDHPRSRGVYAAALPGKWIDGGSSPLARGLLTGDQWSKIDLRIIPARAGFTGLHATAGPPCGDHPRSRGVYTLTCARSTGIPGSSPLARGLQYPSRFSRKRTRIIPARAGFTAGRRGGRSAPADHPRSRGVYWTTSRHPPTGRGSSPLARGLQRITPRAVHPAGIIPARAGFTFCRAPAGIDTQDHPRSRGVYEPLGDGRDGEQGSSPLARGLHLRKIPFSSERGIIPARAGFTARVLCSGMSV